MRACDEAARDKPSGGAGCHPRPRTARVQLRLLQLLAALLLSSPLFAQDATGSHDPVAQWLNRHSHQVMEGTVAVMLLVGDYDTVRDASVTFDGMLTSLAASEGLKVVVDQPRPNEPAATDGFPSSHATAAFAFARGMTDWRSDWGLPVYAFATAVSWARVDEGYHTVEQVAAGAALGVWLAGVSVNSDGLVINRGSGNATLLPGARGPERTVVFDGGPSVVLWKRAW